MATADFWGMLMLCLFSLSPFIDLRKALKARIVVSGMRRSFGRHRRTMRGVLMTREVEGKREATKLCTSRKQ